MRQKLNLMKNRVFLLGGHDLEMSVVKSLLERNGETVIDKSLSWDTADIENYSEELDLYTFCIIYGIELRNGKGLALPSNYRLVDHHNAFDHQKSALEQVAAILGVELSRFESLVAANDKGYIPAMIEEGATKEEIEEIRFKDRQIQGVTKDDEEQAIEAIGGAYREGKVTVVFSKTSRFSAITDRLFPFDSLLIRSEHELIYYGVGSEMLGKTFQAMTGQGTVYYGGGAKGYFGIAARHMDSEQLVRMEKEIVNYVNKYVV